MYFHTRRVVWTVGDAPNSIKASCLKAPDANLLNLSPLFQDRGEIPDREGGLLNLKRASESEILRGFSSTRLERQEERLERPAGWMAYLYLVRYGASRTLKKTPLPFKHAWKKRGWMAFSKKKFVRNKGEQEQ